MTDEKVTSEVETVRAVLREVIAERFKLSAEVERLTRLYADAKKMWTADVQEFGGRYKAAEAKLTALVAALTDQLGWLETVLMGSDFTKPKAGQIVLYKERVEQRRDALRQALAHHSAPVGCPHHGFAPDPCCPQCSAPPSTPTSAPTEGAQLRPPAELLAMIDRIVAGASADDPTLDLEMLSALSEAAERIRADTPALIQPQGEERS